MVHKIDVENKIILITGGYGHLGTAVTESLLAHKGLVYVLGRDQKKFLAVFGKHKLLGAKLFFQKCDIKLTASIKKAFQQTAKKTGRIDILINNAYYLSGQSPEEMSDSDWSNGIEGTLTSTFKCIREIIPYLKKSKGKIINVSSMYGMVAPDFRVYRENPEYLNPPHYGAAKAGIIQLTKYYASHLGPDQITVNAVVPGPFPSPKVQKSKKFISNLSDKTALRRIGQPEDLGGAFVFLASNAAKYVTGQSLIVDGGWTAT
jgi:NAD(P)-dependent dehydrogenase (short-subunit alcohol dehydrogenase family)